MESFFEAVGLLFVVILNSAVYRKCLRAPCDGMRLDYAFVTAFCLLLCREPVFGFLKEKNGSQQL